MQISKSRAAAVATALVLAGACVASQPAIAKDPTGSIDSREIKNGTIRVADLNTLLKKRVAQAKTALQEVPDDSVTGAKVLDNSLGADDLGTDSVGSQELAPDSVGPGNVINGSLQATDIASVRGETALDFPQINAGSCQTLTIPTGNTLDGDLILLTAGPTMPGIISVTGRQQAALSATIAVVACNHAAVNLNPASTIISWAVIEN